MAESVQECERARRIDPLVKSNGSVLNTYLYLGRYEDFLHILPDAAGSGFFRFYRGFGEYHVGKLKEAAADFDRAYQEDPYLYTGIGKAFSEAIAGKNGEGLEILREYEEKIRQNGVGDPEATYKMAQAYAVLGDKTSALRMSFEHRSRLFLLSLFRKRSSPQRPSRIARISTASGFRPSAL